MSGMETTSLAVAAAWLAETAIRATVVLALAAAVVQTLRKGSAAVRHGVLVLAAGALVALPVASALLPAWRVSILAAAEPAVNVVPRLAVSMPSRTRPAPTAREARLNPHLVPAAARPVARAVPAPERAGWATRVVPAIALVWLAGVALALARLAHGALVIRRVARRAALVTDDAWHTLLERCTRELGLSRPPLLLRSAAVTAAVVYGHRRPTVLLSAAADDWPYEQRRAFLLHELAHARRRDVATRTIAEIARALYWPHPLAWWLVSRQSAEAERACDDRVLAAGIGADDYAEYLLDAARTMAAQPQPLSVLSVTGRLESRMLAILDPRQRRASLSGRAWAAGAALSLACLASAAAIEPAPAARPKAPAPAVTAPRAPHAPRAAHAPEPARPATPSVDVAPPAAAAPALAPAAPSADVRPAIAPPPAPPVVPAIAPPPVDAVPAQAPPPPPPAPLAPLPAVAPVPPPAPPVPVIRISTSLVQLDAVVTDRDGRTVADLKPEDFEIVEGGRRRQVTHVSYVRPDEHAGDALGRRTVVFLVDDLHLGQRGIAETRGMLSSFARKHLAPTDLVTVAKASDVSAKGLRFASGAAAVEQAAADIRFSRASLAENALPVRIAIDGDSTGVNRHVRSASAQAVVTAESDTLEIAHMASRSVVALKAVVDALRGLPGRKAVVFVSEGFVAALPLSADEAGRFRRETFGALDGVYGDVTLRAAVRGVNDLANRASVVLYGIDPTGPAHVTSAMTSGIDGMNQTVDFGVSSTFTSAAIGGKQREARQNGLFDLAVPTGGLVWRDTFDHDRWLARILADQSGYYLVAYEPDAATFARIRGAAPFHDVEVKVRRQGLSVRSRKGFYGVTDETVAESAPAM
jgi:VWFA-related protein